MSDIPNTTLASPAAPTVRARPLKLGFVALTDAAPLIAAQELGLFRQHGLEVELSREVGWATIRDKVIYGELDAAHAPAPMLWDAQLGIQCPPTAVLTALVLNLHGNALTLSNALAGVVDRASLREAVGSRRGELRLTLGVVSMFSSHYLLMRNWLLGAGIDVQRDVRIVVVPPAQMFRNLAAGTIDGFCAGEPWNSLAVSKGVGWCPLVSAVRTPGHVEKVLMVTQRFAHRNPAEHAALLAALVQACAWCDEFQNRETLAEMLSDPRFLNLPSRVIAPALTGRFDSGGGRIETVPDFHVFHRGKANVPTVERAAGLQTELIGAEVLPSGTDRRLPQRLFREDLLHEALSTHQLSNILSSASLTDAV